MADNKEPRLTAANYGPSIPPAEQPHHRGRNRRCCLFGCLWKTLVVLIVLVLLIILVFYLIVQPRTFRFYVTEANLTQFNYADNTLHYNLALNFTARNPNKKLSIYYDKVEAHAFYEGTSFGTADVITYFNSFRQYKKSTDRMSGIFKGQHVLTLGKDQVSEFEEEKRNGVFDVDLKLYFTIRFRLGNLIGDDFKPKVKCGLKVPLRSNGTSMVPAFEPTKCDVDF